MFRELALRRRSIRAFSKANVDDETIKSLLETSMLAPSAGNLQAWEFVVVKDNSKKKKIADACHGQHFIADAPVVLVVCANKKRSSNKYGERGGKFYAIADACIVSSYLQLAAADEGLGTVWVGAFDNEELKLILKLPDYIEPVGVFPIGHPAEEGHEKERMPLSRVLHNEEY